MEKINFYKGSGAGNDFVLLDSEGNSGLRLTKTLIRNLCDRHYGIGADGILLVNSSDEFDFEVKYYNSDGTTGALCANGARVSVRFWHQIKNRNKKSFEFKFGIKKYSAEIIDEINVKFKMLPPGSFKFNFKIKAEGQLLPASFVNTGAPQVVIKTDDIKTRPESKEIKYHSIDDVPVDRLGREIRNHPDFQPFGTNVNFIKIIDNQIYIRSFERGVEAETLACGTGAVAAALISHVTDGLNPPVFLKTKGGETLIVDFIIENQHVKELFLEGPAKIIFTGIFSN